MAKLSRQTEDTASTESKIVRTYGQIFADGAVIELVASGSDNRLDLLFWNKHKKIIAPQVKYVGRIYQAPHVHETLVRAIRFPSDAVNYGTPQELFDETRSLFAQYVGLAPAQAALVTAWSCSTWFPDCVSSPPTLVLSSPEIGPVITLFRLLSCLCRRSLVLADINRAAFLSLALLQPTLLINQPCSVPKFWNLLGTSNHRGVYVVGNGGRVYNLVGAKAVFRGMADTGSDEVIHVAVPAPRELPPLHQHLETEIASRFQSQFLMYRLRNFHKLHEFGAAANHLNFPNTEIARNLAACIQGESDIAHAIAHILQRQQQDAQIRRGCEVSVAIVEVIWSPLHETKEMTVTQVAELTNALLRIRGETLEYSAEEIGWKLRNLGLDRHRNGGGMVLQFSKENRLLIHQLAQRFGLKLRPTIGCANCGQQEMLANSTL